MQVRAHGIATVAVLQQSNSALKVRVDIVLGGCNSIPVPKEIAELSVSFCVCRRALFGRFPKCQRG